MAELTIAGARDLARTIRYSGDVPATPVHEVRDRVDHAFNQFSKTDVQISEHVTPLLHSSLNGVCERLLLPCTAIQAFVYASPEIQAHCIPGTTGRCLVRFSSALVDLLDESEFEFVVGHEAGHFLLEHGLKYCASELKSLEYFIQLRCQEVSADRVGLLACRSMDAAVRAMLKVASGLSGKYLRFDIGSYLAQLRHSGPSVDLGFGITHPTMAVRCRALLWFSLSDFYRRGESFYSKSQMAKLDNMVERDLAKFVDGPARQRIDAAKEEFALWTAASLIVHHGSYGEEEQLTVESIFGKELAEKLKIFLSTLDVTIADDEVYYRLKAARGRLEELIPLSFDQEVARIKEVVEASIVKNSTV